MRRFVTITLMLAVVLFMFSACGSSKADKKGPSLADTKNPDIWYRYINAHTSGAISKAAKIRVIFHEPIKGAGTGHGPALEEIMEIEPSVRGDLVWQSENEFVFSPQKNLEPNQTYRVSLKLAKWLTLEKGLDQFHFTFSVNPQAMELELLGLEAQSGASSFSYLGRINTSDEADPEDVKRVVRAELDGKTQVLVWEHEKNNLVHTFHIDGIQRLDTESTLDIIYDGQPIGVDTRGREAVSIPAKNQFGVVSVQGIPGAEYAARVQFTESLAPDQDLKSLITIPGKEIRLLHSGALVTVYFTPDSSDEGVQVVLNAALRSGSGLTLKTEISKPVSFKQLAPQVRFVGKGVILPQNERLTVPIEAVNLRSVQVTAFEIFSENLAQFLQNNDFGGEEELFRVGRHLWRKTIQLDGDVKDLSRWNRFYLDVTDLLKQHKGSMIRLAISFNRGNSAYPCSGELGEVRSEPPFRDSNDWDNPENSNWDYWNDYYQNNSGSDEDQGWRQRENPCHESYYSFKYNRERVWVAKNFFASDIGVLAKLGEDGRMLVATNRISSSAPLSGTKVKVYGFQNRLLGSGQSDGDGLVTLPISGVPYLVICDYDGEQGYLKVNNDSALPMSHFDIGGQEANRGIKGLLYGERGVWRPGDDLHIMLAVWDRDGKLPKDHPVELEWFDPRGRLVHTYRPQAALNGFYRFTLATAEDAPTGNWTAKAKLGGAEFQKVFKVETVVPNRLKIELKTDQQSASALNPYLEGELSSQWLHGAPASGLKYTITSQYAVTPTVFKTYADYVFDDPTRVFSASRKELDQGLLDDKGKTQIRLDLSEGGTSPGRLQVMLETQVFEKGGQFSIDRFPVQYDPYESYVGIKTPKGDVARGMLLTDTDHEVAVMTLDPQGNPVNRQNVELSLYKIHWRWWWEKDADSLAQYAMDQNLTALAKGTVSTRNGQGVWKFQIKYPEWGRYLIRAFDPQSNHASAKIVFIDWPGWAGKAREESGVGATRLEISLDKDKYSVGDTAQVNLPKSVQGRALLTIENSTGVIMAKWLELSADRNTHALPITANMAPNVYVNVSLIQPHAGKQSDSPIRLYGVVPLLVSDPQTVLKPEIKCAESFAPKSEISLEVKETSGRAMTYTLALVDEGLLGLTRYKTPDLHGFFYSKEALSVKSWDLYDWVVGAYGGMLERVLGLGGDEQGAQQDKSKQRRFPPVVEFLGPFDLKAKAKGSHRLKLGSYVGALRVMVVAGNQGRYGWAEKSVPVKSNLMLAATLPRVVRPGESLVVPVEIFSQRSGEHTVRVQLQLPGNMKATEPLEKDVVFSGPGDKTAFFALNVLQTLGVSSLTVKADSGKDHVEEIVHLPVLAANPPAYEQYQTVVAAAGMWDTLIKGLGLPGSGKVFLELSAVPPLNLSKRLNSLIAYPHGCLEQTVSKVFPQLYLQRLIKLTSDEQTAIQENIRLALEKIGGFVSSGGGFTYWPGSDMVNPWVTSYAGHFLLEAKNAGYSVPQNLIDGMLNYQKLAANRWRLGGESVIEQTYRLLVLSLGRRPDLAAMNRLRDFKKLDPHLASVLAAAFYLAGQSEAANNLVRASDMNAEIAVENDFTFGSPYRNKALLVWALVRIGAHKEAEKLAQEVADGLAEGRLYSTQETAFALMAMAEFYGASPNRGPVKGELVLNGQSEQFSFDTPLLRYDLSKKMTENGLKVMVKNPGTDKIYVCWSRQGVPPAGEEKAAAESLKLESQYSDLEGKALDLNRVKQGQDLIITVLVKNLTKRSFENLALSHLLPAGFQVYNARFSLPGQAPGQLDYQDVRDDRVYSYFALKPQETKLVTIHVNASFAGRFYLPGLRVEAMYDQAVYASLIGQWQDITR